MINVAVADLVMTGSLRRQGTKGYECAGARGAGTPVPTGDRFVAINVPIGVLRLELDSVGRKMNVYTVEVICGALDQSLN